MPPIVVDTDLAPRLRLALTRLGRRLRQQSDGDVTATMLSALSSIDRLGPLTLGELAAAERVQPPTITRVAGRLEERGLVQREVDERDRRVTRVRLTAEGRRFLARSRKRKDAYIARRIRDLGRQDVDALERALPILERLVGDDPDSAGRGWAPRLRRGGGVGAPPGRTTQ